MSETSAQVATHKPSDGPWHEGLVGRPLGANEFALTADGRIRIRGPQVMAGYVDGGGIAADGWLTTGDLGEIDENGRLTVSGRADDMLISGGSNIHPLKVESCLAACPGIRDVAVTGLPDPVWGDLIVALVVGDATPEGIACLVPDAPAGRRPAAAHRSPGRPAAQRHRQARTGGTAPTGAGGPIMIGTLRRRLADPSLPAQLRALAAGAPASAPVSLTLELGPGRPRTGSPPCPPEHHSGTRRNRRRALSPRHRPRPAGQQRRREPFRRARQRLFRPVRRLAPRRPRAGILRLRLRREQPGAAAQCAAGDPRHPPRSAARPLPGNAQHDRPERSPRQPPAGGSC